MIKKKNEINRTSFIDPNMQTRYSTSELRKKKIQFKKIQSKLNAQNYNKISEIN